MNMKKKGFEKSILRRSFAMILAFSMLLSPLIFMEAKALGEGYDVDSSVVSDSENGQREDSEDYADIDQENPGEAGKSESTNTVDKAALKSAIGHLERIIVAFEKKGLGHENLISAKELLQAAKNALSRDDIEKAELDRLTEECYTSQEALSEIYDKLTVASDAAIQTRIGEWNRPNQKVWFGRTSEDIGYAKKGMNIEKQIDYDSNSIKWTVTFSNNETYWNDPFFYVFLPDHEGEVVINKNWGTPITLKESDFEGNPNRWNYKKGVDSDYFNEFNNRIVAHIPDSMREIKSNLNWFKDSFLSNQLILRESGKIQGTYTWTFTTKHKEGTMLEKIPLVIGSYGTRGTPNGWPRGVASGSFGISARHNLQVPEKIYVNDPNHLNNYEKNLVTRKVLEKTLDYYKKNGNRKEIVELLGKNVKVKINGKETTISYEEKGTTLILKDGDGVEITDVNSIEIAIDRDGNPILLPTEKITIGEDGRFTVIFDDDTSATLDPKQYISGPQLLITPETQELLDKEEISEIKINALGHDDFKDSISIDASTQLPKGLKLTKNADKSVSITGTIEDVVFPEGKDSVSYTFKVKTQGPELIKDVTITVKKNPGLVPVGTNERGYNLPILLMSLGFFAVIASVIKLSKGSLKYSE